MSNKLKLILLLFLPTLPITAQLNNDYKEIAKRKIEMVMSYSVDLDGDTTFTKYYYDIKGRITKIERGCWNESLVLTDYDVRGNELSYVELHPRINMDTVHSRKLAEKYRMSMQYDTVEKRVTNYFPGTDEISYMLNVDFNEGQCVGGSLVTTHGDTTFFYDALQPYQYTLTEFRITQRVDSIKNGRAITSYKVANNDTIYFGCEIKVFDKHQSLIRHYWVEPLNKPTIIHKVNGKLYTPLGETDAKLKLDRSYQNKYRRNGTLSESIFFDHTNNTSEKHTYPDEKADQFYSLASLKANSGTLIYKYYN
jgi:hypothetical protein